jgi:mono/diheme cytochrome c family protein
MPAFPKVSQQEMASLLRFITASEPSTGESNSSASLAEVGWHLFQRNCAFCHGRDAAGGETGPDLIRSKLVLADVNGNQISDVIRNGCPGTKMPAFRLSNEEMRSLAVFIHHQAGSSRPGGRRGVDDSDLQTGDVAAGKAYFNGAGGCAKCHSPTGDLAGIASRFQGLKLEERMLYPDDGYGNVMALDTRNGRTLWHAGTGVGMSSSPITYELDGRQYVLTSSGGVLFARALPGAAIRTAPARHK